MSRPNQNGVAWGTLRRHVSDVTETPETTTRVSMGPTVSILPCVPKQAPQTSCQTTDSTPPRRDSTHSTHSSSSTGD